MKEKPMASNTLLLPSLPTSPDRTNFVTWGGCECTKPGRPAYCWWDFPVSNSN